MRALVAFTLLLAACAQVRYAAPSGTRVDRAAETRPLDWFAQQARVDTPNEPGDHELAKRWQIVGGPLLLVGAGVGAAGIGDGTRHGFRDGAAIGELAVGVPVLVAGAIAFAIGGYHFQRTGDVIGRRRWWRR